MARTRWSGDWIFQREEEELTILDVIRFGTIDFNLSGLLWLLMEKRASVIVAAGPVWAGKTTLFHSLLDFLPTDIEQFALRGYDEDFKYLGKGKPEKTYLVAEEISNHNYEYLWGYQVIKVFQLMTKGYAFGTTTHARNIREVAYIFNALGVPLPQISSLGAVITIQVARGKSNDELIRFVDTVSILQTTEDGLVAQLLATRDSPYEKFAYPAEQVMQDILFSKFSIKHNSISAEIEKRAHYLSQLYLKGVLTREEFRREISRYNLSRPL